MPRKRTTRLKPAAKSTKFKTEVAPEWSEKEREEQLVIFLRDYDCKVKKTLKDIENKKRSLLVFIQMRFEEQISNLPEEIKDMTLKEFANAGGTFESAKEGVNAHTKERNAKRLAEIQNINWKAPIKEDDGLEVISEEDRSEPPATSKRHCAGKRVPRETPATNARGRASKSAMPPPSTKRATRSKFATPASKMNGGAWGATPLVTPKFNPNLPTTPENIREMKPGERLISLAGSPVQVEGRRKAINAKVPKDELAHELADITGVELTPNRMERIIRVLAGANLDY